MLCFSHDWSGDPLSKTHLMRLLACQNRILWVNSIGYRIPGVSRRDMSRAVRKLFAATSPLREVEPNLFVLSPLIVPAYGRRSVRRLNRWLLREQVRGAMRRLGFERPVNWVFNPAAAMVAGSFDEELLIYYCVDEYAAFSGVSVGALASLELDLLARADLVITSSEPLLSAKSRHNPRTVLVRHGVEWPHFRAALDPALPAPAEVAGLPRPVLGYFGLIARDWVDLDLLAHTAERFPHASLVMIGRVTMDVSALKRFGNVHFLGRKPYSTLPAYCRLFDAALIPFPINGATLHANPLKAREYLAAGLPVVSTAIPEVQALGGCRVAHSAAEFADQVRLALEHPGPSAARSDSVRGESWESRLAEIESHLARLGPTRLDQPSHRPVALAA